MESDKSISVDEKTAKLIEEMDKSLHNMEHSLGMDHLVVAKILDSYAKLLRQNNLRHLDALNMEARAKAIRAKHNQEEAEKQTEGLEQHVELKPAVTAGQLRLLGWIVSAIILVGLVFGLNDLQTKSEHLKKKKLAEVEASRRAHEAAEASLKTHLDAAQTPPPEATANNDAPVADDTAGQSTEHSQPTGTQQAPLPDGAGTLTLKGNTATATQSAPPLNSEAAERLDKIKNLARENLQIGLEAENSKDYKKAYETYQQVVIAAQAAPSQTGQAAYSDEIAQCYDGYARMADADNHPDVAKQWQQAAADVRTHLSSN